MDEPYDVASNITSIGSCIVTTAQFSEFSYGYAITDNFMHSGLPHGASAPVFPSLIAEGSAGGGYDVKIPLCPVPLFVQFKIPQVIRRVSVKKPEGFSLPYLRAHLRTDRPNQHNLLLQLESAGNLVFYAFPEFWQVNELDLYFTQERVHEASRYVAPSAIGELDSNPHHLAYQTAREEIWIRSDPKRLAGNFGFRSFAEKLEASARTARQIEPTAFLKSLATQLGEILNMDVIPPDLDEMEQLIPPSLPTIKPLAKDELENEERDKQKNRLISKMLRRIAYVSQIHLGCTFAITGRDEHSKSN